MLKRLILKWAMVVLAFLIGFTLFLVVYEWALHFLFSYFFGMTQSLADIIAGKFTDDMPSNVVLGVTRLIAGICAFISAVFAGITAYDAADREL